MQPFVIFSTEHEAEAAAKLLTARTNERWIVEPYEHMGRQKWTVIKSYKRN